jgi:hypothetical protein
VAPEQNHLIVGHTINQYATNMYYECMIDKIILKIYAQESLKSELWLIRYGEKSFGDIFGIFGKWLYMEILSDSTGSSWNFGGLRLNLG